MTKINDILQIAYSKAYSGKSLKMKYSIPKIYPKILSSKPLSSFTQKERKEILTKWSEWYVYYSYRNPETGELIRQATITLSVNRNFPKFEDRLVRIKVIRDTLEKVLEDGFSPYDSKEASKEYSSRSAILHVLELKKLEIRESTYRDYENRANQFLTYLEKKGLDKKAISSIGKITVNNYLNSILKNSSPRNRNNTKSVLSALFSKLANESFIEHNFIKDGIEKLKTKPQKNTAFTQDQVKDIFALLKENDIWLYYFCAHVYYALFRPIEIVRINIPDINIKEKLIRSDTKTGVYYKQIPTILIDEFYSNLDLDKYPIDFSLFTKDNAPGVWETPIDKKTGKTNLTKESNRRGYWGKRFSKVVKKEFGFSDNYSIYSLRHSAIGKMFLVKLKEYQDSKIPNFEERALDFIRSITNHSDNKTVKNYLREIGYYKIDDWSDLLK